MERKTDRLGIPPIPEFIETIADTDTDTDTDAGVYACEASVDLFELGKDDLVEQVQGIITVGEFYEHAAGGRIIHT
ncbi:DsrE/DsrF/DrsH-like family protein [Streptomyces hyaluromycini]|uniref:DsrE/DsrF/DrsH-like family protein n=1 Tax=Streptomyces hyaluromycini TaxID=1377993 RepID=UPI001237C15A|nr:DsrE/DsrF/DrsH-like family protein [Streptomyces hyaluromycini]